MSGILRNLMTLFLAYCSRDRVDPWSPVSCHFRVTPFDCGTRILKSDKYLQLAEAAQFDFLIKAGLFGPLLRGRCRFVNASQMIRFRKPIGMFRRVRVETSITYSDTRCVYFSHRLFVGTQLCGEVLVKVKFKRNELTVPPAEVIGECALEEPGYVRAWEQTLGQMSGGAGNEAAG